MRTSLSVMNLGFILCACSLLASQTRDLIAQEVTTEPSIAHRRLDDRPATPDLDQPDEGNRPQRDQSRDQPVSHPPFDPMVPPSNEVENAPVWWALRLEGVNRAARTLTLRLAAWYRLTAPGERVAWGGLIACAALGLWVMVERLLRLRARKVIPADFAPQFISSIHDGKLDFSQALDHCERNPSPASRVALAALRRSGRPSQDLERAVALATHVECDRLRRNVATLRRVAALAPLIGLMGTLFALSRALESGSLNAMSADVVASLTIGSMLSNALRPLVTGVVIAILALVVYDGLFTRVEKLSGALERLGAETIDAISMMIATPLTRPISLVPHKLRLKEQPRH